MPTQPWPTGIVEDDEGLRAILRFARRIAVLGIKDESRAGEPAHDIPKVMQESGYEVVPVNPTIDSALGVPAVANLNEIDGEIDILNVFRASHRVKVHVDDAIALKPKVFWMQLGIRDDESARRLAAAGIAVVQNRCLAVEHRRLIGAATRRR
jgi:predicted CoA-binding protein